MDIFEVAIREFVMPPAVFAVLVVYRQEPYAVFGESILFDEFIFGLRGWMVVAPRVPLVIDKLTLLDKSLGVFICTFIELNGHATYLLIGLRARNLTGQCAKSHSHGIGANADSSAGRKFGGTAALAALAGRAPIRYSCAARR